MASIKSRPSTFVLIAIGVSAGLLLAVRSLGGAGWDPTVFIKFGAEAPANVAYAEMLFTDPVLADDLGHDGKFFFAQAMDPLYLDEGSQHRDQLDRPRYRAQRMLYPLVAGVIGVGDPTAVAWALLGINILGFGFGVAILGSIAERVGMSRWFGLVFPLNVGMIAAFNIDGIEVWALNFVLLAILGTYAESWRTTAAWLCLAVLTRETAIISVVGLAIVWWMSKERGSAIKIAAAPLLTAASWWAYLRVVVPDSVVQDTEALSAPFVGLVAAISTWLTDPMFLLEFVVALLLLVACVRCGVAALRGPDPVAWSVAGYGALAVVMSEPVWGRYFDFSRILAPVFVAYVIVVFSKASDRSIAKSEGRMNAPVST